MRRCSRRAHKRLSRLLTPLRSRGLKVRERDRARWQQKVLPFDMPWNYRNPSFPVGTMVSRTNDRLLSSRRHGWAARFATGDVRVNLGRSDWRRGRDSNSRSPCEDAGFQDRCIQPLCHLSVVIVGAVWTGGIVPDSDPHCRWAREARANATPIPRLGCPSGFLEGCEAARGR